MSNLADQAKSIFLEAIDKHAPEQWPAFLEQACAGDAVLRAGVEKLLRAQAEIGSFHEEARPPVAATVDDPLTERPGTVIGPYKLLQQIGEGGMGTVFMAEQTHPVRRKVALKVIKAGMDTRQVIARFEAERQALAMMDHLNIARVLDAGTTGRPHAPREEMPHAEREVYGRPYFVMELVHGVPITKYCDDNHLTPRERLELFVPVCQAIQHAHQKGIIHRDIKPSNVMVTLYDGKPVPKVIDFGVAKATEQKLTERTMFTQYGTIVGTLEYMSPEQAEMSGLGVDTRGDIYSLGVLLYELLTGSTPLERSRMREAAYAEVLRLIREEEAPKPSARLSSSDTLPAIAAARKTEPAKLAKLVRGELDWIVLKALEKDRTRRYDTASGFAADVQRYLADEAVHACPPSAAYRFRKFARRNKTGLAIAGLVLFCLVLMGGGMGWLVADRAARHRDAESKILEALETAEPLLREGNPGNLALLSAAQRVEAQLGGGTVGPDVRARAEQLLRDVRMLADLDEIRLRQAETNAEANAETNAAKNANKNEEGRFDNAATEPRYAAAFARHGIDVLALDPADAATRIRASAIHEALLAGLDGWMQAKLEDDPERAHLRQVADAADDSAWRRAFRAAALASDEPKLKALAGQPEAVAQPPAVLAWVGWVLRSLPLLKESAALMRQAQPRHPGDFWINYNLGHALMRGPPPQDPAEAIGYFRAAIAIRPSSAEAHSFLGFTLDRKGDPDAAIAAYQQAIAIDPKFIPARIGLGYVLQAQGRLDKALDCFREAIELGPEVASAHYCLGRCYLALWRHVEAIACYDKAIDLKADYAHAWNGRGVAYGRQGQWDKAFTDHLKASELEPTNWELWSNRGYDLVKLGRPQEADTDFAKSAELAGNDAAAWKSLADTHRELGRWPEAIRHYSKAIELNSKEALYRLNRGDAYAELRQWDQADDDFARVTDPVPLATGASYRLALVRLALQDTNGYRKACAGMLEHSGQKLDPDSAEVVAWTAVLSADAVADSEPVIQLAERVLTADPKKPSCLNILGAAYYRAGRYDQAVPRLSEAEAAFQERNDPSYFPPTYTWLFLAMTHHRLAHAEEARQWLAKAVQAIDHPTPEMLKEPGANSWNRRLTLQLLRREAEALLKVDKQAPPK